MTRNINVLIVGKSTRIATSIMETYQIDFGFADCDLANSLLKAIQSLKAEEYHLCLICDDFEETELQSFTKDYEGVAHDEYCPMVLVRTVLPEDFDRKSMQSIGIAAIISERATHADKEMLTFVLNGGAMDKAQERKLDLKRAVRLVLKELDRVALDRKRGKERKFDTTSVDFISLQSERGIQDLEKYYNELTEKAKDAAPQNVKEIAVPQAILNKDLPMLEQNRYTGASSRVWNKLLGRFGKTEDGKAAPSADPAEPAAAETPPLEKKPSE